MFNRIIMLAILVYAFTGQAVFSQTPPPAQQSAPPPAQVEKKINALPPMKTLLGDNETITQGNMITLTRPVGGWILVCDLDLDHNKRLCKIKRNIKLGGEELRLTFQNTKSETAFFTVETTAKIDSVDGLHMSFAGLEKVMRAGYDLDCANSECVGGFEFSGVIGAAMMSSRSLRFFYVDNKEMKTGEITMDGVKQAMELAATNPYAPLPGTPPAKTEKAEAKTAEAKTEVAKPKRQQPRPQSTTHKKQALY